MSNRPCPCSSGRRSALCCGPYLDGEREPPDAAALMRSRFSALAMGNVDHLWRTLHPEHPDRRRDEETVRRELAEASSSHRYQRLTILDRRLGAIDEESRVLFHALIFEGAKDVSFVEESVFRHDGTGWRYLSGELRSAQKGWKKWRLGD